MNTRIIFMICSILIVCIMLNGCNDSAKSKKETTYNLSSAKAERIVKRILGWGDAGKYSVRKITINDCQIPFLCNDLNGKDAWEVCFTEFAPIKFEAEYEGNKYHAENNFIKEIYVTILAETGQIVKIESPLPKDIIIKPKMLLPKEAEKNYASTTEKFDRLPKNNPKISFKQVLENLYRWGSGIHTAKQVVAYYVVNSSDFMASKPRWIVHLRGMRPYPAKGIAAESNMPEWTRSYLRYTVDSSGRVLQADNSPDQK